jgi:hypothetical protein
MCIRFVFVSPSLHLFYLSFIIPAFVLSIFHHPCFRLISSLPSLYLFHLSFSNPAVVSLSFTFPAVVYLSIIPSFVFLFHYPCIRSLFHHPLRSIASVSSALAYSVRMRHCRGNFYNTACFFEGVWGEVKAEQKSGLFLSTESERLAIRTLTRLFLESFKHSEIDTS